MGRSAVTVRAAGRDDADGLVELWSQLRTPSRAHRAVHPDPVARARARGPGLRRARRRARAASWRSPTARSSGWRWLSGRRSAPSSPSRWCTWTTCTSARASSAAASARRCSRRPRRTPTRSAATTCSSTSSRANRDAHRFYARLGFQPVVTRRMAHVSVLRRRLGLETASSRARGRARPRRRAVLSRTAGPLVSGLRRS